MCRPFWWKWADLLLTFSWPYQAFWRIPINWSLMGGVATFVWDLDVTILCIQAMNPRTVQLQKWLIIVHSSMHVSFLIVSLETWNREVGRNHIHHGESGMQLLKNHFVYTRKEHVRDILAKSMQLIFQHVCFGWLLLQVIRNLKILLAERLTPKQIQHEPCSE